MADVEQDDNDNFEENRQDSIAYDQAPRKKQPARPYAVGTAPVECAGFFDDYLYRQLSWSSIIFLFSLLAIGRMFSGIKAPDCGYASDDDEYRTIIIGNIFCGVGLLLILFGSLIVCILSLLRKQLLGIVWCVLLMLGSVLYIIGSWIVVAEIPYTYCLVGAQSSDIGSRGAIIFGEYLLVALCSILLAIDVFRERILNDFRLRMILYCSFTAFTSLIMFFGYALLANYLYKLNQSIGLIAAGDYAFSAAGWFFVFLAMVIGLIVVLRARNVIVYYVISFVYVVCGFMTAIGYWAQNVYGDHAINAYYIAMSFFIISLSLILAVDMSVGQLIKKHVLKR